MRELLWAALFLAFVTSCNDDSSPSGDPCAGIDCRGHGQCAVLDQAAMCICDQGFINRGATDCEPIVATGCQTTADCDDSDPCTDDLCGGDGLCVRAFGTAACDDGLFCNGTDTCDGHGHCISSGNPCPDQCFDNCDEATASCTRVSADGTPCDDGLYCTVGDSCQSGGCVGPDSRDCTAVADGCNSAACDESVDECVRLPKADGSVCLSNNDCVIATCDGGLCAVSPQIGEICTVSIPDDGECIAVGTSAECRLRVGQVCTADVQCASGHCECVNPTCSASQCTPVDCDCSYNQDRTTVCTGPLDRDVQDVELSCGPLLGCDGAGGCVLGLGDACVTDDECDSLHCTCGDDDCTTRVCHATDCSRCQYVTSGSGECQTTPAGNSGEECGYPRKCESNRICGPGDCPGNVIVTGAGQVHLTFAAAYQAAQDGDSIVLLPGAYTATEFATGVTPLDKDVDVYGATGDPNDVSISFLSSTGEWFEVRMDLMAPATVSPSFSHLTFARNSPSTVGFFSVFGRPSGGQFTLENVNVFMPVAGSFPIEVRASNPTIILQNVTLQQISTGIIGGLDDSISAIVEINSVYVTLSGSVPFPNTAGFSFVNVDYGTDVGYGSSQYDQSNPTFPCGWPAP